MGREDQRGRWCQASGQAATQPGIDNLESSEEGQTRRAESTVQDQDLPGVNGGEP
jgi:hypothetical protein